MEKNISKNFRNKTNLKIIDNHDFPISYFNRCSYVVGIESTLILEAMFCNVKANFSFSDDGSHIEYDSFYNNGLEIWLIIIRYN